VLSEARSGRYLHYVYALPAGRANLELRVSHYKQYHSPQVGPRSVLTKPRGPVHILERVSLASLGKRLKA
jgi:hypothetical protein